MVFDVSKGRNFYGPGGPYKIFAGQECGLALAKMCLDDKTYLDDVTGCKLLTGTEKEELQNWMDKFRHFRCYPVVGRLIPNDRLPSSASLVSSKEMSGFDISLLGVLTILLISSK